MDASSNGHDGPPEKVSRRYWGIVESANYIGIGYMTLRQAAKDRRVRFYRFNKRGPMLFTQEDLDDYMRTCVFPVMDDESVDIQDQAESVEVYEEPQA